MNAIQHLSWASTEVIYIGGYAFVIIVSLLTIAIARRAARMQDLKQARASLTYRGQDNETQALPVQRQPSIAKLTARKFQAAASMDLNTAA